MSTPGDQLLTIISARRKLTWNSFRDAFDVIHMTALNTGVGLDRPVDLLRLRSLRRFSELGHVELFPIDSPSAVAVAPSALIRIPVRGLPTAVFAGARPMDTPARLQRACAVFGSNAATVIDAQYSSQAYAPEFIAIQANDGETLARVAHNLQIPYVSPPPAWTLLHASVSVAQYETSLEWNSDRDLDWLRKDFDSRGLSFRSRNEGAEVYLSTFTHPITRRTIHRIRCGDSAALVDRDWGRWLLLSKLGVGVIRYDPALQRVGIPSTVPLPYLLARALTLFTGRAPSFVQPTGDGSAGIDVYSNIPLEAAEYLSQQLGQQLIAESLQPA